MNFGRNVVSWMAITATVTIGLCAAMGTQGCTVTTGVPDDDGGFDFDTSTPDSGTDTATPDTSTPVNACNECLFGHCAGQYSVCVQNEDCRAIYACATAPGCDSNCVQSCYDNGTAAGKQIYLAYATCDLAWSCADCSVACNTDPSACTPAQDDAGAPDTSVADTSTPVDASPPATCDQCIADNCSAQKSACPAGSDCDVYTACLGACTDATCAANCTTAHQSGAAAAAALANCSSTNCKTACNY